MKYELSYFSFFYLIAALCFCYFAFNVAKNILPQSTESINKPIPNISSAESQNYDSALEEVYQDMDSDTHSKPNKSIDFCRRASDKFMLDDNKGAIEDCNRAINLDPNCFEAYKIRSRAESELGEKINSDKDLKMYVILKNKGK